MSDLRRPADLTCDEVRELAGAFVLGALREEDAAAVRAHLDTCPDAHAEILALAEMLPVLAASVPPVEPSAGLRDRLIAAAAADLEARAAPAPAPTVPSSSMGAVTPKAESIEGGRSRRPWSVPAWALRVAAVVAIVVLGGWNLLLQGQLGDAQAYERQVANVLAVAAKQGSLTVVMTPGSAPATGLAAIDAGGGMTLAMRDLAKPSGTAVYEAWMIAPKAAPVPLGEMSIAGDGSAYLQVGGVPATPGLVVALTREPGPGATTPTLPIVSSGTATASS